MHIKIKEKTTRISIRHRNEIIQFRHLFPVYANQSGVTLLELLYVVVIMSIIAVIAMPNLVTTTPYKIDIAVNEFAQAMRYARSEAIRLGQPVGITVDMAQKRIRVFHPDVSTNPWTPVYDIRHPVSKKIYDISIDSLLFGSVDTLVDSSIFRGACNQTGMVYFDKTGTPWCLDPNTVLLKQIDILFSLDADSRILTLYGITGRVTIQ